MTDQKPEEMSMSAKVEAALRQAAIKVVELAKQTGTPVILWENGRVKEVPPDQIKLPTGEAKSSDPEPN